MKDKVILEYRALESEEENEVKNAISSDDESIVYSRRDSQESNASTSTQTSASSQESVENALKLSNEVQSEVEEIAKLLEDVKVSDKETEGGGQIESLTEHLKTAEEEDFQDRQPERIPAHYNNRGATHPYQQRSVNHYSGGTVLQNEHLNINLEQLQPSRSASASPPQLVELSQVDQNGLVVLGGIEVSNFFNNMPVVESDFSDLFNNMSAAEPELPQFQMFSPVDSDLFNNVPTPEQEIPELAQVQLITTDQVSSFVQRQTTPPHSLSPGSTPSYYSPSPPSFSDISQSIGSPQSSQSMPSTSGLSIASRSPSRLPSVLPNTSDEEEDLNQEGTTQLRNLIDNEMKGIKTQEWISTNMKEVDVLFSELRKLLCKNTRLTDRKLVKIYAIISSILKQNGPLRQFFLEDQNILTNVALKNHPLLLKYIIETMQNLGLRPETISESPATVVNKVIGQNQDMREILKILLALKTKTGQKMFDMNKTDQDGLTAVHRVLWKIRQMEDPEMKNLAISYLKICLENRPDFTLTTFEGRTYLHHAIVLGCGAEVVEMILRYCASQNPLFDLVNEKDANGDCALRLAANLTQGREEVQDVLARYNAFSIDQNQDQNILDYLQKTF